MIIKLETTSVVLSYSFFVVVFKSFCLSGGTFMEENAWLVQIAKQVLPERDISWKMTDSCKCGIMMGNETEERIVGGIVSKPNAWPWMGALVHIGDGKPKLLCGASVINNLYLLTAAHCAAFLKTHGLPQFQVFLGTNDLNDPEAFVPVIESIIIHPRYDAKSNAFDIGLIKLKSPLEFSPNIGPICITPQTGVPYVNEEAIVAGWGTTKFGGNTTTMQMQAMVNVTSNKSCQKLYKKSEEPVNITPLMMCASSPGEDSCQGDSGGPLFLNRKGSTNIYEQIGIVAFGNGCADSRYPGVYSRTSKFLSWIKSATRDAIYCSPK